MLCNEVVKGNNVSILLLFCKLNLGFLFSEGACVTD